MRSPLILLLLLSSALGGCAAQPAYVRPTVALGETFRNSALQDGGEALAQVQATDRWWSTFGDPKLDRLIDEALSGNLDIESAAARLQQAAAGARAARAAALPLIGADASAAVRRQSVADASGRSQSRLPGYERTVEQYGLGLAASWEIDLFGSLAAQRRAANADLAAADAQLAGAGLSIAAEVAVAYLDLRELDARLAIAQNRVATLGSLDQLVRLRFARGLAARTELDQTEADLASARAALPALAAAREVTLNRIDLLAGRAPGFAEGELGAGSIPYAPGIIADGGPATLLFRRPDRVAAERAVAAADARTAQALADRLPKLSIGTLAGFLSAGVSNLLTGPAGQASASGELSGPLLDFGRTGAAADRARAATREAVANYRMAVLRAAGEAEDGFSSLARGRAQADETGRSVTALARARDTARIAYRAGAVSLIEALDSERRVQSAEDAAATARAEAARAAVATFRALGGGYRKS